MNIFHGRVEGGQAILGPLQIDYPEHPHAESLPAAGYTRPHELEVDRVEGASGGFWATLRHANAAGAAVKLELVTDDDRVVHVETTRKQHAILQPTAGERLYVRPRQVRIFVDPERGRPL